jgi:hypothetical protein
VVGDAIGLTDLERFVAALYAAEWMSQSPGAKPFG